LAKLTTIDDDTKDVPLDTLHPEHAKALKVAGLAPEKYPTLGEVLNRQNDMNIQDEKKKKKRKGVMPHTFLFVRDITKLSKLQFLQ